MPLDLIVLFAPAVMGILFTIIIIVIERKRY